MSMVAQKRKWRLFRPNVNISYCSCFCLLNECFCMFLNNTEFFMNNTSITTRKVLGLGQYFVHTLPVYVHNGRLINSEYITKESERC